MADPNGQFIWRQLVTADVASAASFYADVVGWTSGWMEVDGVRRAILHAGSQPVAAVTPGPPGDHDIQGWVAYVYVEDVQAAADKMAQLGGVVREAPSETKGIGRFAIVADPQGALIGLFAPSDDNRDPQQGDPTAPGRATWHELYVDDPEAALPIYTEIFGWRQAAAFEMGPAGRYQVFALGDAELGGVMRRPPQLPTPGWNIFFQVEDITSAEDRVKSGGGSVVFGPRQVPGGGFALVCLDPQGALFALSGPKR